MPETRRYYANRPGKALRPNGEEVDDDTAMLPGSEVIVPAGEHQGKKATILQVRRQEPVGEGQFADVAVCSLNLCFYFGSDGRTEWGKWSSD